MSDMLVPIFEALTPSEAKDLADRLDDAGIEAFVDYTDSPLDALTAGRQSKIIRVHPPDVPAAREVVRRWRAEGYEGVTPDEIMEEEAGMELPSRQRPSGDSPSADIEGQGVERLDADRPGPETPEIEEMRRDDPGPEHGRDTHEPIRGFGADRPIEETPDIERPEIEEKPIDQLDIRDVIQPGSEETKPSANLRAPRRRGRGHGRKRKGKG